MRDVYIAQFNILDNLYENISLIKFWNIDYLIIIINDKFKIK